MAGTDPTLGLGSLARGPQGATMAPTRPAGQTVPISGTGAVSGEVRGAAAPGGTGVAVTNAQATAATTVIGTDPHASERAQRNEIMNHMLAGSHIGTTTPQDQHRREVISAGMDAYSMDQLKAMDANHVHFRLGNMAPAHPQPGQTTELGEYTEHHAWTGQTQGGRYVAGSAHIASKTASIELDRHMLDDTTPAGATEARHIVRHEMGHAWDDAQRPDEVNEPTTPGGRPSMGPAWQSETNEPIYTDPQSHQQYGIQDMYREYQGNVQSNPDNYIGGPQTPHSYAGSAPKEFYAEGYAVFHGEDSAARERMRQSAPAFYSYLLQDAQSRGTMPPGM